MKCRYDITKEPVPVVPAAHYVCGGVNVDLHAKSSIDGLYVIGEAAHTGVHGANRLASNSLLEAVVFAHRALDYIKTRQNEWISLDKVSVPPWDESGTVNTEEWVLIAHDKQELQELMWDYVGIIRSNIRLQRALRRVLVINEEVEEFYRRTRLSTELIELRNLAAVSYLMIRSALRRKESRGLHYNTDYPNVQETERKNTYIQRNKRKWERVK